MYEKIDCVGVYESAREITQLHTECLERAFWLSDDITAFYFTKLSIRNSFSLSAYKILSDVGDSKSKHKSFKCSDK